MNEAGEAVTDEDRAVIQQLRDQLGDALTELYDTEFNLRRWLVGWNYDLGKIVPKLRNHLEYRKAMGLDLPTDSFEMDPIMAKYYPSCTLNHTTGKDNSIVQILSIGKADVYGLMHSVSSVGFMKTRVYHVESCLRKVMEQEKKSGRVSGVTYIFDLDGLKFDAWTLTAMNGQFKNFAHFIQEHYVEITQRVLVINAGKVIYALWRMIQPLLAHKTRLKVHIFGSDWRNEILDYVNADRLPSAWGGSCPEDDKVHVPKPIPSECFYKPCMSEPPEVMLEYRLIPRSGKHVEELAVDDHSTSINWFFKSDAEVTFGVFYSPVKLDQPWALSSPAVEMVFPKLTIWTNLIPEHGRLSCRSPGYYYAEFGNESWLFSRSVKFQFSLARGATPLRIEAPEQ